MNFTDKTKPLTYEMVKAAFKRSQDWKEKPRVIVYCPCERATCKAIRRYLNRDGVDDAILKAGK